jgi:hypothetical protein
MENYSPAKNILFAAFFSQHKYNPFRPGILAAACGLVVTLTALPAHAQSCAQRPPGMVAWWPLDEQAGTTIVDIVGGHNGSTIHWSGNPPPPTPIGVGAAALAAIKANTWNGGPVSIPGKVGNSLQFGYPIYAQVPNATDLNFGTGDFTIDAWIKLHSYDVAVGKGIVNKTDAYGGYLMHLGTGQPTLQLRISDGTNGGALHYAGPVITAPLETWIFVAVVRSGKTVTLYANNAGGALNSLTITHGANPIPIASSTQPLQIGKYPPTYSDLAIDELEIFNRALTPSEIQGIFNAGSAGKCKQTAEKKGMTWLHSISNPTTGTITVGCAGCDGYKGDTDCKQKLPLLCIYKPTPLFPLPAGVSNADQYFQWSGGVVATTAPVAGNSFAHSTDATKYCVTQFGPNWRVAEFHDGQYWNFQAYGGTVDAPTVPSKTRFWVHINDQPAGTCWLTP